MLVSLLFSEHADVRPRAGLRRGARADDPLDLAGHRRRRGDVLRGRGADRDVRDPGSLHALRMTDFAATITAAYATEGAAIDLGRGVHEGELVRDAAVQDPARDDEPARARRRRDRHGQDEDAAGARRAALARRRPGARRRRQGRRVRARGARAEPGGAGEKRMADLGLPFAPEAFPVEFLSLGGLGPGVPVRATVSDFGPQLLAKVLGRERDAGVEPRARVPLRRREGPAAARPRRPARAAHVPGLRRRQAGARGDRRALVGHGRRAAALARRARDRRRDRVLRRAAARRRRPAARWRPTAAASSRASSSPPCRTSRRCGRPR